MGELSYYAGATLPMALLAFAGSYFGIWKKRTVKLSRDELTWLFMFLWTLTAFITFAAHILLSGYDETTRSTIANYLAPLIIGVIAGREVVAWRKAVRLKKSG